MTYEETMQKINEEQIIQMKVETRKKIAEAEIAELKSLKAKDDLNEGLAMACPHCGKEVDRTKFVYLTNKTPSEILTNK